MLTPCLDGAKKRRGQEKGLEICRLSIIKNEAWLSIVMCAWVLSDFSSPTLCNPMNYSPPGSSVHGILQIRILEWVVISFSRGSSRPKDQTPVSYFSCIGKWILYHQCYLESPSIIMCSLLLLWVLKGFK